MQAEELIIIKKPQRNREKPEVKRAFMQKHSNEFRITAMSRVLGVSRSGFYRFRQRAGQSSKRHQERIVLDKLVARAFAARKMRAGSPRMFLDLLDQRHRYDRKTVAASMRRQNLRARAAKKYRAATNSKHNLPVTPNLLAQNFSACAPNQKWVSAIHVPLERCRHR